ncbi:nSTAND1 domain-containing NTPase [Streptomyces sp. NPDC001858]
MPCQDRGHVCHYRRPAWSASCAGHCPGSLCATPGPRARPAHRPAADRDPLVHEALLTAWPRRRGWIDEDRERLRTHRRLTEAARA